MGENTTDYTDEQRSALRDATFEAEIAILRAIVRATSPSSNPTTEDLDRLTAAFRQLAGEGRWYIYRPSDFDQADEFASSGESVSSDDFGPSDERSWPPPPEIDLELD